MHRLIYRNELPIHIILFWSQNRSTPRFQRSGKLILWLKLAYLRWRQLFIVIGLCVIYVCQVTYAACGTGYNYLQLLLAIIKCSSISVLDTIDMQHRYLWEGGMTGKLSCAQWSIRIESSSRTVNVNRLLRLKEDAASLTLRECKSLLLTDHLPSTVDHFYKVFQINFHYLLVRCCRRKWVGPMTCIWPVSGDDLSKKDM